jgi:signal transduction histidine kinase
MGLENLRDRVEAIGGGFDVTSGPSTGTTVRAVFPL